MAQPMRGLEID